MAKTWRVWLTPDRALCASLPKPLSGSWPFGDDPARGFVANTLKIFSKNIYTSNDRAMHDLKHFPSGAKPPLFPTIVIDSIIIERPLSAVSSIDQRNTLFYLIEKECDDETTNKKIQQ